MIKMFFLAMLAIAAFGLWLADRPRNDPMRVLGVCLGLTSAAIMLLLLWFICNAAAPLILENLGYGSVER